MVPLASLGDARAPRYSGYRLSTRAFVYGGLTLCAVPSQVLPLASVVRDLLSLKNAVGFLKETQSTKRSRARLSAARRFASEKHEYTQEELHT
jgi:hypothetical protein